MIKNKLRYVLQFLRSLGRDNTWIFNDVYSRQLWGQSAETPDHFSSGDGSDLENSEGYIAFVSWFLEKNDVNTIVDIGCGDFRVSERILLAANKKVRYVGIDAASLVIERNLSLHGKPGVEFYHCDATRDPLPSGDLVLLREVLQHLSNADIQTIMNKTRLYKHNIITNTVALGATLKNIDLPSGSYSRAGMGSGLWLDLPPFNCCVRELARWRHQNRPTELVTVCDIGRICSKP